MIGTDIGIGAPTTAPAPADAAAAATPVGDTAITAAAVEVARTRHQCRPPPRCSAELDRAGVVVVVVVVLLLPWFVPLVAGRVALFEGNSVNDATSRSSTTSKSKTMIMAITFGPRK